MEQNCDKERLLRKAEEVLAHCEEVTVASVNNDGYPRPIPMAIMKAIGCNEVWIDNEFAHLTL